MNTPRARENVQRLGVVTLNLVQHTAGKKKYLLPRGARGWLSWPTKIVEARMSRMQLPRAVDGEEVSLAPPVNAPLDLLPASRRAPCSACYGSPTPATTKLQDTITQWLFGISENQTYR